MNAANTECLFTSISLLVQQSLIKEAISFDSKGHLTEAMNRYRRGLELLLKAVDC